jgi:hypothetical protein
MSMQKKELSIPVPVGLCKMNISDNDYQFQLMVDVACYCQTGG